MTAERTFIETTRLRLRDWREDDFPAFAEMNADPRVMEFFLERKTEAQSREFFDEIRLELARERFGLFAAERKSDGALLGFVGLRCCAFRTDFSPCTEISWRLRREFWGKGYASEAAIACLRFGFEDCGLREIFAFTALPNARSRRVMEKAGMRFVKEFDHPTVPREHPLLRHALFRAKSEEYKTFLTETQTRIHP